MIVQQDFLCRNKWFVCTTLPAGTLLGKPPSFEIDPKALSECVCSQSWQGNVLEIRSPLHLESDHTFVDQFTKYDGVTCSLSLSQARHNEVEWLGLQ